MTDTQIDDLNVVSQELLISPADLKRELPMTDKAREVVTQGRETIRNILDRKDPRIFVVIGPCSIHDVDAAMDYAQRLKKLADEVSDTIYVVMRVYFEKPRTTTGWKGLINDPDLDDSFQINKGIRQARKLLADLAERGMPAGVEFLDLITPQYLADLVAWGAIGARTTESQGHRELASGLSCPVGFKNGTGGSIKIAVDAVGAARHSHHFLSLTKEGQSAIFQTAGNADSHVILRGGANGPNFDADAVAGAIAQLGQADLPGYVMIDFSHANSRKQHKKQLEVGDDVGGQIAAGSKAIFGVMIESHLKEGAQKLVPGMAPEYGVSITDACLGWEDTEKLLGDLAHAVSERRGLGDSSDTD